MGKSSRDRQWEKDALEAYNREIPYPATICDKNITWVLEEGFVRGYILAAQMFQEEIDELIEKQIRIN